MELLIHFLFLEIVKQLNSLTNYSNIFDKHLKRITIKNLLIKNVY